MSRWPWPSCGAGAVIAVALIYEWLIQSARRLSLLISPPPPLLAAHGREIQGMSLQSYLFFEQVKSLFAARPDRRFLLFDFRLVTGINSSAIHSFTQIKRAAEELGARLVLVNLSPELHARFSSLGVLRR